MPRLYDEALSINCADKYLKIIQKAMPAAQVFLSTNIHKLIDPHGVYEASKDFPNAAPPFSTTWTEWSVAQSFADAIKFPELSRCGTLTISETTDRGFTLHIYGILEMGMSIAVFPGEAQYTLDTLGNVINHKILMPSPQETGGVSPEAIDGLVIPTLLTFSLLNCKNVTTQENKPYQNEIRRWKKRNKNPLCRYHTLNISTMSKILKEKGNIKKNGPAKALHICRGHFRDYTKNGLFGKHKGTYYFGPTIRGNKANGLVTKDYNMEA